MVLIGAAAGRYGLVNEFLGYLADPNYSSRTRRAYAFDLLAFIRWLDADQTGLAVVDVDVLLRYLTACRAVGLRGTSGRERVLHPRRPQPHAKPVVPSHWQATE